MQPNFLNQQSSSEPARRADLTQPLAQVATQEQPRNQQEPSLPQEEQFLLPRSAWTRPVTRLRVLMQVKRLLDRQEAKFEQSKV